MEEYAISITENFSGVMQEESVLNRSKSNLPPISDIFMEGAKKG